MKITFGAFFRNTPATIMRCGRTFRLAGTHPAHARSSGSETLSRSRSLAGYTIDTHESEFSEATPGSERTSLAPILFGFALHRRRIRVLHLEPIRRSARTVRWRNRGVRTCYRLGVSHFRSISSAISLILATDAVAALSAARAASRLRTFSNASIRVLGFTARPF